MKRFLKIVSIIFILIFSSSLFVACDDSSDYVFDVYEEIDTVIIREYKGRKKDVVVPEKINGVTVRKISNFAFAETDIESVVFPDGVIDIGTAVFINCPSLKTVSFGSDFYSSGYLTFKNCSSLESLYFSGNAPVLGHKSFQNDSVLTIYYTNNTTGWDQFKTNYSDSYPYFKFVIQ